MDTLPKPRSTYIAHPAEPVLAICILAFGALNDFYFHVVPSLLLYPVYVAVLAYPEVRIARDIGLRAYLAYRRFYPLSLAGGYFVTLIATTQIVVDLGVQYVSDLVLESTVPTHDSIAAFPVKNEIALAVLILGMFLIVAPLEEYIFRHWIQRKALIGRLGAHPIVAVLLTSAIFAIAHVAEYGLSVQPLTTIFIASLLYGAVYEWTDNLTVSTIAHGLNNALALVTIYLT